MDIRNGHQFIHQIRPYRIVDTDHHQCLTLGRKSPNSHEGDVDVGCAQYTPDVADHTGAVPVVTEHHLAPGQHHVYPVFIYLYQVRLAKQNGPGYDVGRAGSVQLDGDQVAVIVDPIRLSLDDLEAAVFRDNRGVYQVYLLSTG